MAGIRKGSAIVGRREGRGDVRIYYEDDPGGSTNLATFAQRALVAFERLVDRAPTHKVRIVPREALRVIGTFSPSRRQVALAGRGAEDALVAWLGTDRLESNDLHA